jgi:hypothetical protein
MKKMLPLFFAALSGLASCSKSTPAPSLVGSWTFVSQQDVTTSPTGKPVRVLNILPGAGRTYVSTFGTDGILRTIKTYSTQQTEQTSPSGLYTFDGKLLEISENNFSYVYPTLSYRVSELTANRLVTVYVNKSPLDSMVTTTTYSR